MREHDACGIGFVADAHGRSSHHIVAAALEGLAGVKHRGATAADARTSDGTGVLVPLPAEIFGAGRAVASLMVRHTDRATVRDAVEQAAIAEGLAVVEWRSPPLDLAALGETAAASCPELLHAVFVATTPDTVTANDDGGGEDLERRAYRMRRRIGRTTSDVYVASCSFRTIVYKGLVAADAFGDFFLDLRDERFRVPFAIFHQRFSTNTLPTWERSQPFRTLCQNGEINTIGGNEIRMIGRGNLGTVAAGLGPEDLFRPLLDPDDSDSGRLDETVELLVRGGRDIDHAVAMVVPEAWEHVRDLDPDVRGFHEYHGALMEPWDGPAGLVFTDGRSVGAALDRNGLRPLRFAVTADGLVVCCSEMGAIDLRGHGAIERGRLGPGHMLLVSPEVGVLRHHEIDRRLTTRAPYAVWAADGFSHFSIGEPVEETPADLRRRQATHGYTKEELAMVIKPMAEDAYEPTFSMGDDSPLPNFVDHPRPISHYLRQRFAQVTNPPIDPLRERLVMSTRVLLGPRRPLLSETADAAHLLCLPTFFVYPSAVAALDLPAHNPFPVARLDATFAVTDGAGALEAAVIEMSARAVTEVGQGAGIIVIDNGQVSATRAPVPSLLAVGAVNQALTQAGRRSAASIVVVADDAREVHGIAALIGYGADAICPRLALETVAAEADRSESAELVSPEAQSRYQAAVEIGVLKVLSKMGIATIDSYRGGQLFEVLGLGPEVVERCFAGTASVAGGIGWTALGEDALALHASARWDEPTRDEDDVDPGPGLTSPGFYRVRKGGEPHTYGKEVVSALNALALVPDTASKPSVDDRVLADMAAAHLLQRAIAGEDDDLYRRFAALVNDREPSELHDLLELRPSPGTEPVPLDEVESATAIVRRFSTGAMSHGSLSKEAHENLARAMNLIGAMSNCGEGGEDPERFRTRGLGRDDRNSRIKQVASGRFGVTPEYLAFADEIQIKMAQGSKPGEGGQLPGHKVSAEIARLRHTQPGIGLISPPPHHDIYSIEDLAQLVFDLKQVNAAQVSVKLVSVDGVGTIAAGVVKALADVVHLSGANGGTGASPLSSIKHAGMPWELGLADTQRALVANGLRSRVRLRVDGGFKTGRQVITAALLGADEYAFGTAAMIAEGCIMLRACHRDTCKPGVATQRPHLRANFRGTPEGVAAYFLFVAEEVRRDLAHLGARTLDEVIGRADLLTQRTTGRERADAFDLTSLVTPAGGDGDPRRFLERAEVQDPRSDLGDRVLADAYRPIWDGDRVDLSYAITNADRTVGAALAGALSLEYGLTTPRGSATVIFTGSAGQSFGAFLTPGISLLLTGEANDYVGKGMAGGRVVIRLPEDGVTANPIGPIELIEGLIADPPALAGNTCLYGATGGELFVAGAVGERFAVRNSGATAVVEAAGDHCGEYMTGGTVVVLGPIGYNLGAGMTGGQVFIWDPEVERVLTRVNVDLVEIARPDHDALEELRWLVEKHVELTASAKGRRLLDGWADHVEHLWQVLPRDRHTQISTTVAHRVANV